MDGSDRHGYGARFYVWLWFIVYWSLNMNGVIVDTRTGEFVVAGDYGNLAEELLVLHEMGQTYLKLFAEDKAFALYG